MFRNLECSRMPLMRSPRLPQDAVQAPRQQRVGRVYPGIAPVTAHKWRLFRVGACRGVSASRVRARGPPWIQEVPHVGLHCTE